MVESTKKDTNPVTDTEQDTNDPVASDTENTQAEKWLDDYRLDPLEGDMADIESSKKVNCLSYWEQQKVNAVKVCRLQYAHKVNTEYLAIKNCVSSALYKHTERIDANIDLLKERNKSVQDALNIALENLKAVKSALNKVNELSCKLDLARHDACHSEQRNAMSDLPSSNGVRGIQLNASYT
ncbi:MAG: hypothetical protein AAGJ93_08095, partial [Bacteroidota bacterium]